MGFLDKVERGLEKVVTSFFRGTSTSEIKPVELTTALRNEMDRGILPISEGRSLAPNDFVVSLSEKDFETAKGWGSSVVNELAKVTAEHASTQGYSVQSDIMIHFVSDPNFKVGEMEINGSIKDASSKPAASAPVREPAPKPSGAAAIPASQLPRRPPPSRAQPAARSPSPRHLPSPSRRSWKSTANVSHCTITQSFSAVRPAPTSRWTTREFRASTSASRPADRIPMSSPTSVPPTEPTLMERKFPLKPVYLTVQSSISDRRRSSSD